jgi:hypothetical protein
MTVDGPCQGLYSFSLILDSSVDVVHTIHIPFILQQQTDISIMKLLLLEESFPIILIKYSLRSILKSQGLASHLSNFPFHRIPSSTFFFHTRTLLAI